MPRREHAFPRLGRIRAKIGRSTLSQFHQISKRQLAVRDYSPFILNLLRARQPRQPQRIKCSEPSLPFQGEHAAGSIHHEAPLGTNHCETGHRPFHSPPLGWLARPMFLHYGFNAGGAGGSFNWIARIVFCFIFACLRRALKLFFTAASMARAMGKTSHALSFLEKRNDGQRETGQRIATSARPSSSRSRRTDHDCQRQGRKQQF